jgi:ATP-dependent Lon protease
LPVLPLRGTVVFPHTALSLVVGKARSVAAVYAAFGSASREIFLVAQRLESDSPEEEVLHMVGTVAVLDQIERLPDGSTKILAEGRRRARVVRFMPSERLFEAELEELEVALMRQVKATFERLVRLEGSDSPEMLLKVHAIEDPDELADRLIPPLQLDFEEQQRLLELSSPSARLEYIEEALLLEIEKREERGKAIDLTRVLTTDG